MQFTPPFHSWYTRTVTIHDNIGIAFPLQAYTPTITTWYAPDGHVLKHFVDRSQLRYDQCLRHHHGKGCN